MSSPVVFVWPSRGWLRVLALPALTQWSLRGAGLIPGCLLKLVAGGVRWSSLESGNICKEQTSGLARTLAGSLRIRKNLLLSEAVCLPCQPRLSLGQESNSDSFLFMPTVENAKCYQKRPSKDTCFSCGAFLLIHTHTHTLQTHTFSISIFIIFPPQLPLFLFLPMSLLPL